MGIKPLEKLQLSITLKTRLILEHFAKLSVVWRGFEYYYRRIERQIVSNGYYMPKWLPGSHQLWSARALQVLDIVARDVADAAPGDLYLAHLLIPHYPYVYDRSCNLRNPRDWEGRRGRIDAKLRAHLYALYLEQVECIKNRLQGVFRLWRREGVYDGAKITLHGDHGSRLSLPYPPMIHDENQLLPSDYIDLFSTLFAVKSPGVEPRYDRSMVAIQDIIGAVADDDPLGALPSWAPQPYVWLRNRLGREMIPRPMPEFGDVPAE